MNEKLSNFECRVILPEKQKADIVQAVKNFEQFQKAKKKLGLDEFLSYGSGMVLLVSIKTIKTIKT